MSGIVFIGVAAFFRESVGFQPFQQFHIHTNGAEGVLGGVEVEIRHARNNQVIFAVNYGKMGIVFRYHRKNTLGKTITADKKALVSD